MSKEPRRIAPTAFFGWLACSLMSAGQLIPSVAHAEADHPHLKKKHLLNLGGYRQ